MINADDKVHFLFTYFSNIDVPIKCNWSRSGIFRWHSLFIKIIFKKSVYLKKIVKSNVQS